jgi:hypothetical protein
MKGEGWTVTNISGILAFTSTKMRITRNGDIEKHVIINAPHKSDISKDFEMDDTRDKTEISLKV